MSRIVFGLLLVVILLLCFLLFWIITLSLALLCIGRNKSKKKESFQEEPAPV